MEDEQRTENPPPPPEHLPNALFGAGTALAMIGAVASWLPPPAGLPDAILDRIHLAGYLVLTAALGLIAIATAIAILRGTVQPKFRETIDWLVGLLERLGTLVQAVAEPTVRAMTHPSGAASLPALLVGVVLVVAVNIYVAIDVNQSLSSVNTILQELEVKISSPARQDLNVTLEPVSLNLVPTTKGLEPITTELRALGDLIRALDTSTPVCDHALAPGIVEKYLAVRDSSLQADLRELRRLLVERRGITPVQCRDTAGNEALLKLIKTLQEAFNVSLEHQRADFVKVLKDVASRFGDPPPQEYPERDLITLLEDPDSRLPMDVDWRSCRAVTNEGVTLQIEFEREAECSFAQPVTSYYKHAATPEEQLDSLAAQIEQRAQDPDKAEREPRFVVVGSGEADKDRRANNTLGNRRARCVLDELTRRSTLIGNDRDLIVPLGRVESSGLLREHPDNVWTGRVQVFECTRRDHAPGQLTSAAVVEADGDALATSIPGP